MPERRYITTAIDYPNAPPHMGHVLEKVMADVIARWKRLSGADVRFQVGTDEHGVKIAQTAKKEGVSPRELVDRNVPLFEDLYARLQISFDHFIRTTDQKEHWPTVQALWKKLQDAGMLEKRTYTGLYCSGCERFLTKRDLVDGVCVLHQRPPEEVQEENWFFLLSRETAWLKELLSSSYRIVPESRAHETMALLEEGLEDVSFSRPKTTLDWGIPVPGDEDQLMYVWCDALTNYISGLGFFTDHEDRSYWDDAEVMHVIGKDITRFHALIWPAMLKHAGVRIPDHLLVHGFLTSEGQKMSKSLGNVVKPDDVLERFNGNPDPLRFYLSHEIPVGNDGDFSWKHVEEIYDAKLRNQIGNLLNRILVMLNKEGGDLLHDVPSPMRCADQVQLHWKDYHEYMSRFDLHAGIQTAVHTADTLNVLLTTHEPWKKETAGKMAILTESAEVMRHAALMLLPFIPATAQEISRQLDVPYADRMLDRDFVITEDLKKWGLPGWKKVGEPRILFAPLP